MSPALTSSHPSSAGVNSEAMTHIKSADEMDDERREHIVYEYLCRLEEAKRWIEAVLHQELPEVTIFEQNLRNGVVLAKIAATFAPSIVTERKIFDVDETRFLSNGLHFRHTDNINYFLKAVTELGLPNIFCPETTDVYDAKNIPRVVYSLHALSLFLYRLGKAPPMSDLLGKATFTAEQISSMKSALDAYGLPMPQFKRIGGILTDELPVDEAAFHAAIMAINNSLDSSDYYKTLKALQNPNACLNDVDPEADPAKKYHLVLYANKEKKIKANSNEGNDAYDELLTQEEIQTHIDKINQLLALEKIEECVKSEDLQGLQMALNARYLSIEFPIKNSLMEKYLAELERRLRGGTRGNDGLNFLRKEDVINAVSKVNNQQMSSSNLKFQAVKQINLALERQDPDGLVEALLQPVLGLTQYIWPFASTLYLEELTYVRQGCNSDIRFEGIKKLVEFLSIIARINITIENNDKSEFFSLVTTVGANIEDVMENNVGKYLDSLKRFLMSKQNNGPYQQLLNHGDIQEIVDQVNHSIGNRLNFQKIEAIRKVNEAVEKCDAPKLRASLLHPDLLLAQDLKHDIAQNLQELCDDDAVHLLCLMRDLKANISLAENEDHELWMNHIVDSFEHFIAHSREAKRAGTALAIVNMAVNQMDPNHTFQTLLHEDLNLIERVHEKPEYIEQYQKALEHLVSRKKHERSPWVVHTLTSGDKVYLNLEIHTIAWRTPNEYRLKSQFINAQEIEDVIIEVNQKVDQRHQYEAWIIKLQSRARGFLVRQRLFGMLQNYYENESKVIKIQAIWRGRQVRRRYANELEDVNKKSLAYFRRHEKHVKLIQRVWRAKLAKRQFRQLLETNNVHKNMDVPTVRKFLHLLDLSPEDFSQELEMQTLKAEISKKIRSMQGFEKDLDSMDIKIGLLVKNRIDVQEVVAHGKNLNRRMKERRHPGISSGSGTLMKGLKALKRESREKLDAYQHLFYHLQTHPEYLAKLIFVMPQTSSTKFLDSVILSLYNFGANQREEYMLLKLFKTALEEEIYKKVDKLSDIVSGNPMVIKLIVGFYKSGQGQAALRQILGPLIKQILDNKDLHINTNPVEIYKQWINAKELESGEACGLPYNVTVEDALKHEEVKSRLASSITKLKQVTTMFLATIVKARRHLPYGIQYMAKILFHTLKTRCINVQEKDLLKVVGNLIYYRYINSAIVAPDTFNIVDISAQSGGLNNDQRRNLGSVAKILQFVATKKGFGDESPHLTVLNPYIIENHEKFKKFFQECIKVPDPEDAFSMDQFTEATLIAKPVIYISLQELYDTHVLLLEHLDKVAPEKKDPLRELLEDLGDSPSICSLLGAANGCGEDSSITHLAKTEVCLTLTNRFTVPVSHQRLDMDRLFVKTKQLIMMVLPCTNADNLIGCLKSKTMPNQEEHYWNLVSKREQADQAIQVNASMIDHTTLVKEDGIQASLNECKRVILKNLQVLERHGYASIKDGFASIVSSLAKDICSQRSYRSRRRREIFRLKKTTQDMERKIQFLESQVEYYDKYLKQCLANLHAAKKKRVHFRTPNNSTLTAERSMKKETLRYSALKLHQKGILHSIDGLPENQFKNVLFEIVPTDTDGLFTIHAKFMGVRMEHVEVDIQDLLQLQYEGISVMDMFGKAKINVNLLLHFLNAKFYGRRK